MPQSLFSCSRQPTNSTLTLKTEKSHSKSRQKIQECSRAAISLFGHGDFSHWSQEINFNLIFLNLLKLEGKVYLLFLLSFSLDHHTKCVWNTLLLMLHIIFKGHQVCINDGPKHSVKRLRIKTQLANWLHCPGDN